MSSMPRPMEGCGESHASLFWKGQAILFHRENFSGAYPPCKETHRGQISRYAGDAGIDVSDDGRGHVVSLHACVFH